MREVQPISDYELVLMQTIWKNGNSAMYADIVDSLQQKHLDWKKNTIITLLSRLVDKGFLKTSKIGRRNEYQAIVSEDDYNAAQTVSFVDKLYGGEVGALINTLLHRDMISDAEKKALWDYWRGSNGNE